MHQEPTRDSNSPAEADSIRDLGRYRSYLRLKALDIAPHLRTKLEPSDIVQQTMLDAHKKLDQFRGDSPGEMARWLSQILANNMADAVRALHSQKRDARRELRLHQQNTESSQVGSDWLPGEQTSPSLKVQRAEQMLNIEEALAELPAPQQEVIILHHLKGRSLNEVAELTQRSTSSVAGLLYRGLKTIRQKLDA